MITLLTTSPSLTYIYSEEASFHKAAFYQRSMLLKQKEEQMEMLWKYYVKIHWRKKTETENWK